MALNHQTTLLHGGFGNLAYTEFGAEEHQMIIHPKMQNSISQRPLIIFMKGSGTKSFPERKDIVHNKSNICNS